MNTVRYREDSGIATVLGGGEAHAGSISTVSILTLEWWRRLELGVFDAQQKSHKSMRSRVRCGYAKEVSTQRLATSRGKYILVSRPMTSVSEQKAHIQAKAQDVK